MPASRIVHCQDAITWLESQPVLEGCSVITSLPDVSEFPSLSLEEWKSWFIQAVTLILTRLPDDGVAIFYQTDLKKDGVWVDKGFLVQMAAEASGHALLWHKVVSRVPPGNIAFGRPGYSHMLCFSKGIRPEIKNSTPDVLPEAGEVTWTRGMGLQACLAACRFVLKNTPTQTIVDPFCGHGSVLAIANELGLAAIGIEKGPNRARKARAIRTLNFKLCD